MVQRNPTYPVLPVTGDFDDVIVVEWTGLLNGDTMGPVQLPNLVDRSIQVAGAFGIGGSLRVLGTNFSTFINEVPLNDAQGNILDITAAKIEQILEMTLFIGGTVTAGDGTTSLTVRLLAKRG